MPGRSSLRGRTCQDTVPGRMGPYILELPCPCAASSEHCAEGSRPCGLLSFIVEMRLPTLSPYELTVGSPEFPATFIILDLPPLPLGKNAASELPRETMLPDDVGASAWRGFDDRQLANGWAARLEMLFLLT